MWKFHPIEYNCLSDCFENSISCNLQCIIVAWKLTFFQNNLISCFSEVVKKRYSQSVPVHSNKYFSDYFQIERNTIVVTVIHLIINPTEFRWVHSQKENRHYDHIPLNWKVIRMKCISLFEIINWFWILQSFLFIIKVYSHINVNCNFARLAHS